MIGFVRTLLTVTLVAFLALQVSLASPALSSPAPESAPPCHTGESHTPADKEKPVISAHMICCSLAMIAAEPVALTHPHSYVTQLRPHRDNRPVSYAPYEALRPPNAMP